MTPIIGLRVNLDGGMDRVVLPARSTDRVTALHTALACDTFDIVGVEHTLDLFVDDEGLYRSEHNPMLSLMLEILGQPRLLSGPGIFLGGDPTSGETLSLTTLQAKRLIVLHTALAHVGGILDDLIRRRRG